MDIFVLMAAQGCSSSRKSKDVNFFSSIEM